MKHLVIGCITAAVIYGWLVSRPCGDPECAEDHG